MEHLNHSNPYLDFLDYPAFLVQNRTILQVNYAAQQMNILPGTALEGLLGDSLPVYEAFTGGNLYLTLRISHLRCGASVTVVEGMHLFCLEQQEQADQALALAASKLRGPIHTLLALLESRPQTGAEQNQLHVLHRMVANMADYPRYIGEESSHLESLDLNQMIADIIDLSAPLLEGTGVHLQYRKMPYFLIAPVDRQMLERAIYNLISNAVKHSHSGDVIDVQLTQNGSQIYIMVQDQGDGIPPEILSNVFTRYLRAPGIEDGRNGIGLGLALVKAAAKRHNGTVLIDHPEGRGARVTITIPLPSDNPTSLCSPVMIPVIDYAGGRDHTLLELSDVLPGHVYEEA